MRRWTLAFTGAALLTLASCSDLSDSLPVGPLTLSIVSGEGQSALPGADLPNPLVVRVEDSKGKRIRDQIVNFRVVAGGGSVFAGASITNKDGLAQEHWTLGPSGSQRVEARAVDPETGERLTFAVFTATVIDNVAPTVTINQAAGQTDPTGSGPIVFTVQFSENVIGFDASDVSFAGSTVGGTLSAAVTGSDAHYTVSVSEMTGTGTVVASIPAGVAHDGGSNPNTASTSTDNTVTFNTAPVSVTINQAAVQNDPTNNSPVLFTVAFSQPVTGFDASDIDLSASSLSGLVATVSGSGATYTVSVTGMNGVGTVVASVIAGAASSGGASSLASTSTDNQVTFDNVQPTVTINQATGQADPTNAGPISFSVVFSEAVVGFAGDDISLAGSTVGGTLFANVTGSGASYTVMIFGMAGEGSVVASIGADATTDLAGNTNLASTSADNSVTFAGPPPSVTINQASVQNDPTNASPVLFTVVFSREVSGFTDSDVDFSGSTLSGLVATVSGSLQNYTVSVTGMNGVGTVVASIPAGAATSTGGIPNSASTSTDNMVTFDNVRPTVTINQAMGQPDPTNSSPILFTVVFSEAITGFGGSDISLAGSTVGGTLVANVSGSGATYTVSVTGMNGIGTVVASIPDGVATDLSGNANLASTSIDNTVSFQNTPVTVTINQAAGQPDPVTAAGPVQFTVVFSQPVIGFNGLDVSTAGSTMSVPTPSVTGSGANYTVTFNLASGNGVLVASIPASVVTGPGGTPNSASTSTDNQVAVTILFSIGGNISGLDGVGCLLSLNGGAAITLPNTATSYTFPTRLPAGASYGVTVVQNPTGPVQTCSISNAFGVVGTSNITNVGVTCSTVHPTCSSASFLGSVSGDDGAGTLNATGDSERWYRVRITENDESIFSDVYLSAQIRLQSPSGADYDLYVYCMSCGGSLAGSSTAGTGATDMVNVRWEDDSFGDETADIYIQVRHFNGGSASDWTLSVFGNVAVSVVTCDP